MSRTKKIAILAIIAMVLTLMPAALFAATADSDRLSGDTRVGTALAIADDGWTSANAVVLAPADQANLVDALAAAPLAGQENAPILLTFKNSLDPAVKAKIDSLDPTTVYVIGAISDSVKAEVEAINGVTVEVLKGNNRLETCEAINAKLTNVAGTFVVGNNAVADALSVASYAAKNRYKIIVANAKGLVEGQIASGNVYLIGGPTLVANVSGAERIYGADRFETNSKVAATLGFTYDKVYVANGLSLVDALSVAPLAAKTSSFVALASANSVAAASTIATKLNGSSKVIALGGPNAVSDSVKNSITYKSTDFAIESFEIVNAAQMKLVFSEAVDKDTLISGTNFVATLGIEIDRLPAKAANDINEANLLVSLGSDEKTVTITADDTDNGFFDGTYSVYIPAETIAAKDDGAFLKAYRGTVSMDDATSPEVKAVAFNAATNRIDVQMSEPCLTEPTVIVNNGAPLGSPDSRNTSQDKLSWDNDWEIGTTITVKVFGAIDMNDNEQESTYTTTVKLSQDNATPTISAVSQKASNKVKVTFSKAPNGSNDANKETTVGNAVDVYRSGVNITVDAVAIDATDSSKRTYILELDQGNGPDYAAIYDGKSSVTLTVVVPEDGYLDVYSISNPDEIRKTVSMSKDKSGPTILSLSLNDDKDEIIVRFNEDVDDSTLVVGQPLVRQDGIDVTSDFTFATGVADDQTIYLTYASEIPAGTYTVRFDDDAIKDMQGNDIDAQSKTITIDSTDSVVTGSVTDNTGNSYTVTFSDAVGASGVQASSYTLDGTALPDGTDLYFDSSAVPSKSVVNIILPSSSVNYDNATAVLRVARVYDSNGSKVDPFTGTVAVEDNVKPVLKSANVVGNIITMTFDEEMDDASGMVDFTGLLGDLEIKGGTVELTGTTGTLNVSTDGKKVIIVVSAVGDSNWNTVKAYSKLSIKTLDGATYLKDASNANNLAKKDVTVNASVTR